MARNQEFCCGAQPKEPGVRDVRDLVKWAAEPVQAGTSIKAQIRNAANALRLDFGTVKRAWYGIAGNEIYPVIYNAWLDLVARRAREKQEAVELAEQIVLMEKALERARQDQALARASAAEPHEMGIPAPSRG